MKKICIFATCLLFMYVSIADALPGRHREGAWPEQDWTMDHMMISNLDLSAEQLEKVHTLTESFYKDMAPLRNQKFQLQTELRLLWMQEKPDTDKIRAKQKELHDLKWRIVEQVTDYRFSFRDILSPEQLSRFLVRRCDRPFYRTGGRGHHGPWVEKMRNHGPPPYP